MAIPRVGEIKTAKELGRKGRTTKFIWRICIDCGKGKWVQCVRDKPLRIRCIQCTRNQIGARHRGQYNPNWKGGRKNAEGYIRVWLQPDNFFYSMTDKKGYVLEHRLVMAKYLQRCLLPWEVIHHKNSIKDDNRLENLELLPTNRQHLPSMLWQRELVKRDSQIQQLAKRVTLLEAESATLRHQLEEIVTQKQMELW